MNTIAQALPAAPQSQAQSQALRPITPARPALRLINTKTLSRDAWLDVRRQGIGSSDAAAAVGLNPYQSPLALWLNKTGRPEPLAPPKDADSDPLYWGTQLEHFVAEHYTRQTGRKVRRCNAVLQHPEYPWMLANIDREVIGVSDVQILECKTAGMNGSRLWRDGVPEYVQLQVQHQLAVTGKQAADVAVLLCGNDFKCYRIERDEALIGRLIELEQQFWQCVVSDTPPPSDGSASAGQALQALYPASSGPMVDFSDDTEMSACFADLLAIRARLTEQEAIESQLKQRIQERIAEASGARFGSGEVSWKRSKDSLTLDVARLLKEQPGLLERYPLTRAGSRRFVVSA